MADISSVVNYFPVAKEGFTTTTSSTIGSGATTVPLNSVTGYTNGDTVVLVIEPGDPTKKQVFTGVVDTAGTQITGVVWTEGTNTTHDAGSTVVDYVTATHQSMVTAGVLTSLNPDGTMKNGVVTSASLATGAGEPGDWTSYTPTYSASGSMTYTSVTTVFAKYTKIGDTVILKIRASGTTGGTASTTLYFDLPVPASTTSGNGSGGGSSADGSTVMAWTFLNSTTQGAVRKADSSNYGLGASRTLDVTIIYEAA